MIKKLLVVSLAAMGIGLTGCLLDPEESTAPTITLGKIDTLVANSGTAKVVTGKIESSEAVTGTTYEIFNSANQLVPATLISRSGVSTDVKEKSQKITVTLQALTGAVTGDYTLKITATAGVSGTASFPFYVQGATTPVSDIYIDSVTLGAFDNADYGSSLDLDNGQVMKAAAAKLANSGVDIVYTYSDALNTSVILNPVYAKESSGVTAFASWVSPNDTKFHKVAVNFDAITTSAQIEALYNATEATEKRVSVNVGDVLVVKTDEGAYVLVKIKTTFANAAATAMLKCAL